ncbi:MAG: hypothetical protein AAGG38_10910 [Planctomycetota bacterium]
MPRKPLLILSPTGRSAAIAVLMLALLAGSLGLAWALTGAPLVPPGPPPPTAHDLGGATLELPPTWVADPAAARPDANPARWVFINTASPGERLSVWYLRSPESIEPAQVLGQAVQSSIAGKHFVVAPDSPERFRLSEQPAGPGMVMEIVFSSQRATRTSSGASPEVQAMILVTADRQDYWVYRFTDQVPQERWVRDLEDRQLERLRHWVGSAADAPAKMAP